MIAQTIIIVVLYYGIMLLKIPYDIGTTFSNLFSNKVGNFNYTNTLEKVITKDNTSLNDLTNWQKLMIVLSKFGGIIANLINKISSKVATITSKYSVIVAYVLIITFFIYIGYKFIEVNFIFGLVILVLITIGLLLIRERINNFLRKIILIVIHSLLVCGAVILLQYAYDFLQAIILGNLAPEMNENFFASIISIIKQSIDSDNININSILISILKILGLQIFNILYYGTLYGLLTLTTQSIHDDNIDNEDDNVLSKCKNAVHNYVLGIRVSKFGKLQFSALVPAVIILGLIAYIPASAMAFDGKLINVIWLFITETGIFQIVISFIVTSIMTLIFGRFYKLLPSSMRNHINNIISDKASNIVEEYISVLEDNNNLITHLFD